MSIIQRLKIKMCDLPVQLATGIRSWCTARKDSLKQTHHNHPWIWRAAKWIVGIIVFGAICTMYYSERNARIAERGNDIAEAALQVSIQSKNLVAEQMFKDGVLSEEKYHRYTDPQELPNVPTFMGAASARMSNFRDWMYTQLASLGLCGVSRTMELDDGETCLAMVVLLAVLLTPGSWNRSSKVICMTLRISLNFALLWYYGTLFVYRVMTGLHPEKAQSILHLTCLVTAINYTVAYLHRRIREYQSARCSLCSNGTQEIKCKECRARPTYGLTIPWAHGPLPLMFILNWNNYIIEHDLEHSRPGLTWCIRALMIYASFVLFLRLVVVFAVGLADMIISFDRGSKMAAKAGAAKLWMYHNAVERQLVP